MVFSSLSYDIISILFAVYSFILFSICFLIYEKTLKIEKLSGHVGLFLFNKTFLLLAFAKLLYGPMKIIRFALYEGHMWDRLITFTCYFFFNFGIFFFVFSLFYKKFSFKRLEITSVFFFLSILFGFFDVYVFKGPYMLFSVQVLFLTLGSIRAYFNVRSNDEKLHFDNLIFVAILLLLISWIMNILIYTHFSTSMIFIMLTSTFTITGFSIYLQRVSKFTKRFKLW